MSVFTFAVEILPALALAQRKAVRAESQWLRIIYHDSGHLTTYERIFMKSKGIPCYDYPILLKTVMPGICNREFLELYDPMSCPAIAFIISDPPFAPSVSSVRVSSTAPDSPSGLPIRSQEASVRVLYAWRKACIVESLCLPSNLYICGLLVPSRSRRPEVLVRVCCRSVLLCNVPSRQQARGVYSVLFFVTSSSVWQAGGGTKCGAGSASFLLARFA